MGHRVFIRNGRHGALIGSAGPASLRVPLASTRSWLHTHPGTVGTVAAMLFATAAALPAVWWEPLHVDEQVTLGVSPRSFETIVEQIFGQHGGAPAFFFLEHGTLAWPGGLEGLRLPSLVLFLASLPAAALLARDLIGRTVVVPSVLMLALAPLAVGLATFGRMYSLLLASLLWSTWLLVRAARSGRVSHWVAAGVATGLLVYVHPIAPLSIFLAFATAIAAAWPLSSRAFRGAVAGAAAALVVGLPYYIHALGRLRERYYIGYESSERLDAGHNRSVLESSFLASGGGRVLVAAVLVLLAVAGLAWLARRDRPLALVFALWLIVPVVFFSFIPAGNAAAGGTRFFDRYLLPSLWMFVLLVAAGCTALARRTRWPVTTGVVLIAFVLALEAHIDFRHLNRLRAHNLGELVSTAAPLESDAVLFSATGAPAAGRPPELLDEYLALELSGLHRADERSVDALREFLVSGMDGVGIWVLRGTPDRIERVDARLRADPELRATGVGRDLLLVHSALPAEPRALVAQAARVRLAWIEESLAEPIPIRLLAVDRAALADILR